MSSVAVGRGQIIRSCRKRFLVSGRTTTSKTACFSSVVVNCNTSFLDHCSKAFPNNNKNRCRHRLPPSWIRSRRLPGNNNNNNVATMQQHRGILSSAIQGRLDAMVTRHGQITEELMHNNNNDPSKRKELSSLARAVALHGRHAALEEEERAIHELREEAESAGDGEMSEECENDLRLLEKSRKKLESKIVGAILSSIPSVREEHDQNTNHDAIVEIRAGTGGDEAALFASELLEVYKETCRTNKWKAEMLTLTKTALGGIKEASFAVVGNSGGKGGGGGGYGWDEYEDDDDDDDDDSASASLLANLGPYGLFRFESGGHRVQRNPVTDPSRIHTSACSVAVLPSLPSDDAAGASQLLPMSDLRIETMRASGAGGQHVNTTDSAVRITHVPTGITAAIQDERSQHKNKAKALKLIAARVREKTREEEERERGETRSSLMGGGDRSERIRTYNFPQDRITDHRCKESLFGIEKLFSGSGGGSSLVASFYPLLAGMRQEELLTELEEKQ